MKLHRRKFVQLGAAGAASVLAAPSLLRAQSAYPNKPIQIVVPFNPGGGADRTARLFAPYLAEELGSPVNVINISGGGGWVAWQQMAQWSPENDDHMLGMINFPHLFSYLDPRVGRTETVDSFNFVAWHSLDPCVWAIRADEDRFDSLATLIEYVQANPGEVIFSSTAVGSDDHMGIAFAEKFIDGGFDVRKLYANGDSKKLQEVIGGVSDVVAGNVGYYTPYVNEGQIKFITVLHDEPYERAAGVPTFQEVTGKPNVSFAGRTLAMANGLSEEKKEIMVSAISRAMANPDYIAAEEADNNNLMFLTGDAIDERIQSTLEYVQSVRFWEEDV